MLALICDAGVVASTYFTAAKAKEYLLVYMRSAKALCIHRLDIALCYLLWMYSGLTLNSFSLSHVNVFVFICSVDTRDSDFGVAEQWSGGEILGQRATFRADRHPAALILTNVKPKDEALYRCRVDFRLAQTRNAHVNLTVIGNVDQSLSIPPTSFLPVTSIALVAHPSSSLFPPNPVPHTSLSFFLVSNLLSFLTSVTLAAIYAGYPIYL